MFCMCLLGPFWWKPRQLVDMVSLPGQTLTTMLVFCAISVFVAVLVEPRLYGKLVPGSSYIVSVFAMAILVESPILVDEVA